MPNLPHLCTSLELSPIETINMNSMHAFPDNPVDENIMFAQKINEIIERLNLLTSSLINVTKE